jgi:adenylate cyclase
MIDSGTLRAARTSFLIGLGVFVLTCIVWRMGYFEAPELWVYDHFVQWRANPKAEDPRIMLVLLNEKDIEKLDYPLKDSVLSAVLEKIESGGPSAVGLDFYRDLPEPRDGSQSAVLNQTLLRYPNIISIFSFGTEADPFAIKPPAVLIADSTRYGFHDFPEAHIIRRAYFYLAWQGIGPTADGNSIRIGKTTIPPLQSNDGGYVNDPTGGYAFMQDFRGPAKFASMSISDVLALGNSSIFKNKIVLVGIAADSSNDVFNTPTTELEPGVAIHAQIVNQLLRAALNGDRPTSSLSQGFSWFWMFLWCVVGAVVGLGVRSHILFALSIALCLGLIVLSGWLFFLDGYWILVFGPATVFLATAMLVKAYAATNEERQRATLMKLFSQHVPTQIAEEIWSHREIFLQGRRPPAQKQVVTALFTDLQNYSTISEKMTPNELIAWVNECQSALAQHVDKNGGTVNTYMGDGMMAVFGVPKARTTETEMAADAVNAVNCALSMAAEIKQKNARWKAEGKPLAGLRVGIFTGEAMSGYLGSDDHLEYSVIGDTVNTASRLESFDKDATLTGAIGDCRILIGSLTYQYVKDRFPARPVGRLSLKGKKDSTEVYKVLDSMEQGEQNHS